MLTLAGAMSHGTRCAASWRLPAIPSERRCKDPQPASLLLTTNNKQKTPREDSK